MNLKKIPLFSVGLIMLNPTHSQTCENGKKMNVLFIAVDDLKPALGCYGDSIVKTPNIDKLAASGTVFLKNYCQQAVSGPTRASLMTGKRPDYTKVWDLKTKMRDINPDILTIPQYFARQGYTTSGIGKIYDSRCVDSRKDEDKPSWTVPYYTTSGKYYFNNQPPVLYYYQNTEAKKIATEVCADAKSQGKSQEEADVMGITQYKPSVECLDLPDNAYTDGAQTSRVLELLSDLSKSDKPFFFAVGFARPHLPFVAPKKYWDLYNREDIPLAKFRDHAKNSPELAYTNSVELRSYTDIPPLASFTDINVNRLGLAEEKQKELIHGYYACVSYIDAQIGKILNHLDSLGMTKNTVIVLWGDHGWHLGDHDLWCKHTNFENSAHAPLIIASPKLKNGKTNSLTEFVDIFPTLCDLTGIETPKNLDGKSLKPLMLNPVSTINDYAVSQFPHEAKMGYSIRTERYRLTWWMANGFRTNNVFNENLIVAQELYDYKKDPLETINVINEKSYESIAKELKAKMIEFFKNQQQSLKNTNL